jgi:abortive infection bacteriophage resistance protein
MSCTEPARTYLEQLEILKGRGLLVTDEPRALHCLAHQNYYRLSACRSAGRTNRTPTPPSRTRRN